MRGRRANDPMEALVRQALHGKGFNFVEEEDPRALALDFHLPDWDVHVEVKRFHSYRIAEQMARAPNVIAVQGEAAVHLFCQLIEGYDP